jgi:superfamily II DNA or RNA helicase
MKELRTYQKTQLWDTFSSLKEHDAVILQGVTGSGKGVQMSYIFNQCLHNNKHVLFLVYGRLVVDTFCTELEENHIPHTVMMAGRDYHAEERAVVASISSLWSWYFKEGAKKDVEDLYAPHYVLVDECRRIVSPSCQKVLQHFKERGSKIIGFDATPKAKNLSKIYTNLLHGENTPWHIQQGNLVPIEHYAPALNDADYMEALQALRTRGNDYVEKDLMSLEKAKVLIGDVVDNYERISVAEFGRLAKFCVACMSQNHARSVQAAFTQSGHKVAYIDASTPEDERRQIFDDIYSGEIIGIISVLVLIYGVNIKCLEIGILARPTKDVRMLLQFGGRILRLYPGKEKAVFIDHTRALYEIGYIDDAYSWYLGDDVEVVNETRKKKSEEVEKENADITCPSCGHVFRNAGVCPKCDEKVLISYDAPNVVYYNTELIKQREAEKSDHQIMADKAQFAAELRAKMDRDYGGALHKKLNKFNDVFRIKYGESLTPSAFEDIQPAESISIKTRRYITYCNIRMQHRAHR